MKWKILLIVFLISLPFWWGINVFQKNLEDIFYAQISQPFQEMSFVKVLPKAKRPKIDLQVKSALSVEINKLDKKKILFKKEPDQILPIASLTKLMTAIIVLEDKTNYDFSRIVTVSKEAVAQSEDFGNFKIEDKLSVKDLLYIMLIESSNDAAFALAEDIGVENFVEKMNQKAKILGLTKTHFINPSGLDSEDPETLNNSSTAQDLVELAQHILNHHSIIFEISSKALYEVLDSSGDPHHLAINKNELLTLFSEDIIGGKTGYTDEAGACLLLTLKNKKGNFFINVILGTESREASFEEMKKLVEWLEI